MWLVFILDMAELFEEHTVNEELMPAVPSMSEGSSTGEMFAKLVAKSTNT